VKETQRNLFEMGQEVRLKSFQNKKLDTPELVEKYTTKEIQGETFSILDPLAEVKKAYAFIYKDSIEQPDNVLAWANVEFLERVDESAISPNPGEAWKLRRYVWEPIMVNGRFEYTYNERFFRNNLLLRIINQLVLDRNSRRQVLNIYSSDLDQDMNEQTGRVSCSLDYSWLIRDNKLIMFYHMRSCDFYTHFINDMYLAGKLNDWVTKRINDQLVDGVPIEPGKLIVLINSLHAYRSYMIDRNIF